MRSNGRDTSRLDRVRRYSTKEAFYNRVKKLNGEWNIS